MAAGCAWVLASTLALPEARGEGAAAERLPFRSVLLVGDSMLGGGNGLAAAMAARLKSVGVRPYYQTWVSASLVHVVREGKLSRAIDALHPDAVVLVLGTNDADAPEPQHLSRRIREIVRLVGKRPCLWVGPPPLRKPETGITEQLMAHAAPCAVLDSRPLALERRPDGIHPTDAGGATWADAIFRALATLGGAAHGSSAPPR